MKIIISLALLLTWVSVPSYAQRIVCTVGVNVERLPLDSQTKLAGLQNELENYMNGFDWTENEFQYDLNCQLEVAFSEAKTISYEDRYQAAIIISNGIDLQYADKRWEFALALNEKLDHSTSFHPFTALIDFYTCLILAYEYDKLFVLGGDRYLDIAHQINESAKFNLQYYKGWDRRAELIAEIKSESNKDYRRLIYNYHTGMYFFKQKDNDNAVKFLNAAMNLVKRIPKEQLNRFFDVNYTDFINALKKLKAKEQAKFIEQFNPESR